ncbi:3'-5' exonuclease [Geminocystis sp. GBBB08]|uniref:3'-5' exonuclease n=1 Tax=Geminocystis sp. GBBB08 TaxID=2604140 RepID=UPI0027E30D71|nr:3'-5' exonuclease [Geminocystis sp. GBBB08]MBL1209594.1 3'-5' exonuclease [Geminocystis sp. GBBB08]
MIYLTDIDEIKNIILDLTETDILWLDTEVADYHTKKPRLSLIQILAYGDNLNGDRTYMLDVLDKPEVINFFIDNIIVNESIKKVFHHANYDLRLLGQNKAKNVVCTLKLAKEFPYHFLPVKNYTLKCLTEFLTDFKDLSKEEQGSNWGIRPLEKNQLEYAKMDCVYLAQIYDKLMNLKFKVEQNPLNKNLDLLTKKYQEIEEQWLVLDSEITYLKKQIQEEMIDKNIKENDYFKLTLTKKNTIKTDLQELVKLVNEKNINVDFSIILTKAIQQKLGDNLQDLNIDIETNNYYTLKSKNTENKDSE